MKPRIKRAHQQVPEPFAGQLRRIRARQRHEPRQPYLRAVLAAAVAKGWTCQALADVIGVTRERVRQMVAAADCSDPVAILIPDPPIVEVAPKILPPMLTPEQALELRALSDRAQAKGWMGPDDPEVVASRELAAMVQGFLDRGHRITDLAQAMGVTYLAVHYRLARQGYRHLPPSMQSRRGPITEHAGGRG